MTARILQLSDTHVVADGSLAYGRVDTGACLARAIRRIQALEREIGEIDAVLVTGDLTDRGTPAEFNRFLDLIEELPAPVLAIPGNHDARGPMRRALGLGGAEDAPIHLSQRIGDLAVIAIDTTVPGTPGGEITAEAAGFLEDALTEAGTMAALVALHHPPFATGIGHMDRIGLAGSDRLARIVAAHSADLRIVCGHVHRTIAGACGGRTALIAPSTAHSVAFDLSADGPARLAFDPPGAMLHVWDGRFVSHVIQLGDVDGPYPFRG